MVTLQAARAPRLSSAIFRDHAERGAYLELCKRTTSETAMKREDADVLMRNRSNLFYINELRSRINLVIVAESCQFCHFQARKQRHAVPALERVKFRSGTRSVEKLARWTVPFVSRSKGPCALTTSVDRRRLIVNYLANHSRRRGVW